MKILKRASNFILHPKPKPSNQKEDANNNNNNDGRCTRIGNLTFNSPSDKVWAHATSVASDLAIIVSHITLEQRMSYILQQNRS